MNPAPPPTETPVSASSFHHQAGTYAVLAIPTCIVLNLILASALQSAEPTSPAVKLIVSAIPGLVLLSAFPAGIIALCGIPKYGIKKLLWKGLVGVSVPILLIALAIPAFLRVKNLREERARQQQQQGK